MKPKSPQLVEQEPLQDATREQLYDCATLLALSVVDHRAKFGVVPIENSAPLLRAAKDGSASSEMIEDGWKTMESAMKIVKQAADQHAKEKEKKIRLDEKRRQVRINISAPVYVIPPGSKTPLEAKLENISWGGAALHTSEPIGQKGDFLLVMLPSYNDQEVVVQAEILRTWEVSDGFGYGVRFSKVRTADEEVLQKLLESLVESKDDNGQRLTARLTQRIDIQYDDVDELQATLEDISTGGLGITVPEPMEKNQSLLVAISSTDEQCQLLLRARVVRQQELEFSNVTMYRAGLEFEHASEDVKERVSNLIRKMATIKPTTNFRFSGL